MCERKHIEPGEILRIVGVQPEAALKRRYRFRRLAVEETRHTKHEMSQRKARRELDRPLGGGDRAIKCIPVGADDSKSVVRVWILLVEPNGRECRLCPLVNVVVRYLAPAIGKHAGV